MRHVYRDGCDAPVDDGGGHGEGGHGDHRVRGEETRHEVAVAVPAQVELVARRGDGGRDGEDEGGAAVAEEVVEEGGQPVSLEHGDQRAVEKVTLHD